ncbi:MAG: SPOR domain-containing protein [Thiotrichales bacterium]
MKQKLVGAAVLIALAVIFIPMLLDGGKKDEPATMQIEVPQKPVYEIPNRLEPVMPPPVAAVLPTAPIDSVSPPAVEQTTTPTPSPTASTSTSPAPSAPPTVESSKSSPTVASPATTKAEAPKPAAATPPAATPAAPTPPAIAPSAPAPAIATAPKAPPRTEPGAPGAGAGFVVQVGSFSKQDNADSVKSKLAAAGFPAFVETVGASGNQIFRVKVGPRPSREAADDLRQKLIDTQKMEGIIVTHP